MIDFYMMGDIDATIVIIGFFVFKTPKAVRFKRYPRLIRQWKGTNDNNTLR